MKELIFDIIAVILLAVIVHITRKFENKKLSNIIIVLYLAICAFVNLRAFIGAIVPEFGHKWGDWIVETEPTCETAGVEVRICKNDSSHQERRELPALGHDWQPATDSQPETCARCGKQQGSPLQPSPGPSDMAGYSDIQAPQNSSWLAARETRYAYAPHGAAVYIYKGPSLGYEKVNGEYGVADGTELTLLALENGMYLVKTGNGLLGWINTSGTIETRLIDSMPQLAGSYWIYSKGTGDAYTFACKFDSSLKLVGFRLSDGKEVTWTCRSAGRVLVFDEMKFIWDGEQFTYETQAYLWVDPDQTFDKYS